MHDRTSEFHRPKQEPKENAVFRHQGVFGQMVSGGGGIMSPVSNCRVKLRCGRTPLALATMPFPADCAGSEDTANVIDRTANPTPWFRVQPREECVGPFLLDRSAACNFYLIGLRTVGPRVWPGQG